MSHYENMRYVRSKDPGLEEDNVYEEYVVPRQQLYKEEIKLPLPPIEKPHVKSNSCKYKCCISVLVGIIAALLAAAGILFYFVSI